jgi:protein-tyrosine phosphatase
MNQITHYRLWVGHAADGRDTQEILARDIRAIVQLAIEEPPIELPREMACLRIPLVDGDGNDDALLRLAIDAVAALVEAQIPTLVCCGGGMSRSPAIVAAAISRVEGADLHECLQAVTESHPSDVSAALWDEISRALPAS